MADNKKVTVSVVTVCYNAADMLTCVMDSVLSQTYDNFEYVIKDGASSDDTYSIAMSYADKFEAKGIPFKCVSKKDTGIYDAMNDSLNYCDGTFVIFMNADDKFFDENVLTKIFKDKDYDNSDILYGDTLEIEYGEYYYYMKDLNVIKRRMPFSHQSTFTRKDALLKFPFDLQYRICGDYNFLLDCYAAGLTFTDVNTVVSVVSKEGVSSLGLLQCFTETVKVQREHGIDNYPGRKYDSKLRNTKIKQFGMSHFPKGLKYAIRKFQRLVRKQPEVNPGEIGGEN